MALTQERIREIERATVGQKLNPLWQEFRKNRLTGSVFGQALRALGQYVVCGSKKKIQDLRRKLVSNNDFTCEAIRWGIQHEEDAIKEYERQTGNDVIESGIWLFPEGDLAASPDGLVLDPEDETKYIGLVEVKCPFRCRGAQIKTGHEWSHFLPYLDQNNQLKSSYEYYHQIQGQLCATQLPWCDFVIWCPTAILVQRIELDEDWRAASLPALHFIFRKHFLRPEDHFTNDYPIAIRNDKTIDIKPIIKSNPTNCLTFYSALMKSIGVQIGRWIALKYHPTTLTPEFVDHFDEMKDKLCRVCVIRYLLFYWSLDSSQLSIAMRVHELMQGKWNIDDDMWQAARTKLSEMDYWLTLAEPPCLCRKW